MLPFMQAQLEAYRRQAEKFTATEVAGDQAEATQLWAWLETEGRTLPLAITQVEAVAYQRHLLEVRPIQPFAVVRAKLASLERIYTFLQQQRLMAANPFCGMRLPESVRQLEAAADRFAVEVLSRILEGLTKAMAPAEQAWERRSRVG